MWPTYTIKPEPAGAFRANGRKENFGQFVWRGGNRSSLGDYSRFRARVAGNQAGGVCGALEQRQGSQTPELLQGNLRGYQLQGSLRSYQTLGEPKWLFKSRGYSRVRARACGERLAPGYVVVAPNRTTDWAKPGDYYSEFGPSPERDRREIQIWAKPGERRLLLIWAKPGDFGERKERSLAAA